MTASKCKSLKELLLIVGCNRLTELFLELIKPFLTF